MMSKTEYDNMVENLLKDLASSDPDELLKKELAQVSKTITNNCLSIPQHVWEQLKVAVRRMEIIVNKGDVSKVTP